MIKSRLFCILALAAPMAARADGVTDFIIDPAAGFTIAAPGSYTLAQDVAMTADVDALTISADNVTVDLNGHTITGLEGLANGINCGSHKGVVIRNGRIVKTSASGLVGTGSDCVASDLLVSDCFGSGISLTGNGCRTSHCKVSHNSYNGILLGLKGVAENCEAVTNNTVGTAAGINVAAESTVRDCIASDNAVTQGTLGNGVGIQVGNHSVVRNCQAYGNNGLGTGSAYGINAGTNCLIEGNICSNQSSGSTGVYAVGIRAGGSSRILHNVCNGSNVGSGTNGEAIGIDAQGYSLVEGNTCDYNRGTNSGSGRGIVVHYYATTVRGNSTTDNDGGSSGTGYGIYLVASANGSVVDGNSCSTHDGATAYGIYVSGNDVLVRGNSTSANATGGIRINATGAAGSSCRIERNRSSESNGLSFAGTHSLGTGEDANISY